MLYPEKIMRASALEEYLGMSRGTLARLVHFPGQKFAFKLYPEKRNSPVLIDTEAYEKWRVQRMQLSRQGGVSG